MKLFGSKKEKEVEKEQNQKGNRQITIPDWNVTDFENINPDQFSYFLKQAYEDAQIKMEGKQLIALAYKMNEGIRIMEAQFDRHMTFKAWQTVITNIINTGRSGIPGDTEEIRMSDRAEFFEIQNGLEMLAQQYNDIRKKSTMYFRQKTNGGN